MTSCCSQEIRRARIAATRGPASNPCTKNASATIWSREMKAMPASTHARAQASGSKLLR